MKRFEETLKNNKPYNGRITDYSEVSYYANENDTNEEIIFNTEQLKEDLQACGYDEIHISFLLEAIHNHGGAMHSLIKARVRYQISYDCHSDIIEVEEETTDFGALVDMLIDKLENGGKGAYFIDYCDTTEGGGEYEEDTYIIGGNHGRLLYHGGNFHIEKLND